MSRLLTVDTLESLRQALAGEREAARICVTVCAGTGCRAHGAESLIDALRQAVRQEGLETAVEVVPTGCHGFCAVGPVIGVDPYNYFYQQAAPEDAAEIVTKTLAGQPVERLLHTGPKGGPSCLHSQDIAFFSNQQKVVLRNCGKIDPCEIGQYIAREGYAAIAKALQQMTPEQVIEEVKASGLRGRSSARETD